ncbi:MAG: DNA-3-methyladenine glycosylase I [Nitriliruptorales bacterium]|nr:DNA-3-methyladenine glycosylase I [Nitriliruptorales bacterium]
MSLVAGPDGLARCGWAGEDPLYLRYHDHEWGRPVTDERRLFEKLSLEAFQSGLSWLTILRKRDNFRAAFAGFDPQRVAAFTASDVQRLLRDAGIVRNRAKIEATIHNARALAGMPGTLSDLIWAYRPRPRRPARELADLPTTTTESTALARELKRRGFRFVGPTTVYALMQACGVVNDHLLGCVARGADPEVSQERAATPGA